VIIQAPRNVFYALLVCTTVYQAEANARNVILASIFLQAKTAKLPKNQRVKTVHLVHTALKVVVKT